MRIFNTIQYNKIFILPYTQHLQHKMEKWRKLRKEDKWRENLKETTRLITSQAFSLKITSLVQYKNYNSVKFITWLTLCCQVSWCSAWCLDFQHYLSGKEVNISKLGRKCVCGAEKVFYRIEPLDITNFAAGFFGPPALPLTANFVKHPDFGCHETSCNQGPFTREEERGPGTRLVSFEIHEKCWRHMTWKSWISGFFQNFSKPLNWMKSN